MALDPVPWFIGGGAEHSPDVARLVAYAATGGAAGVIAATDLFATTTPAPTGSVRIMPGACVIPNTYPGVSQQSYMGRAADITDIPITPTGSAAGGRSDMIVARIDDPQFGGAAPEDLANGEYIRFEVISNVGSGATTVPSTVLYPAIPIARIDLPPLTATVEQHLIKDLRNVAQPRRSRDLYNTQPTVTSTVASASWTNWTSEANRNIAIPEWATQVKIIGHLSAVAPASAATKGITRFVFGAALGQEVYFDMDASTRQTLLVSDTLPVAPALRGTTQLLKLQAARSTGAGNIVTDRYSTIVWDVEFLEVPSAD